jgi:hypothetical protein
MPPLAEPVFGFLFLLGFFPLNVPLPRGLAGFEKLSVRCPGAAPSKRRKLRKPRKPKRAALRPDRSVALHFEKKTETEEADKTRMAIAPGGGGRDALLSKRSKWRKQSKHNIRAAVLEVPPAVARGMLFQRGTGWFKAFCSSGYGMHFCYAPFTAHPWRVPTTTFLLFLNERARGLNLLAVTRFSWLTGLEYAAALGSLQHWNAHSTWEGPRHAENSLFQTFSARVPAPRRMVNREASTPDKIGRTTGSYKAALR